MKFIKKPAVAASMGAIPHYHVSPSTDVDGFITQHNRNFIQLFKILNRWRDGLGRIFANHINAGSTANKTSVITGWAPLVKASSQIETTDTADPNDTQHSHRYTAYLKNRSVLCIGGRIKLYSQYERIIAKHGGFFLAFHGGAGDSLDRLPLLLEMTDMIICPVDCVNHEAFLMVKRFFRYTQKPCVLLDRSEVRTFSAGIQALAKADYEMSNDQNP